MIDVINIVIKSINWKVDGTRFPNIATGRPKTIHILKMLLPIIFPTKISCSFLIEEIIAVTNSGSDVPRATIVKEITLSEIPNICAISVALFTTKSLPINMPDRPNVMKMIDFPKLYFGDSASSSILFLEIEIK